jgi:hypothetical protein
MRVLVEIREIQKASVSAILLAWRKIPTSSRDQDVSLWLQCWIEVVQVLRLGRENKAKEAEHLSRSMVREGSKLGNLVSS